TPTWRLVRLARGKQRTEVLVAESLDQMLATENCAEEHALLGGDRTQTSIGASICDYTSAHRIQNAVRWGRSLHHRQRLQIALIRRPPDLRATGDVGQALAHRNPSQARSTMPENLPIDFEYSGIVDRRLDPEYGSGLVVHLDRIRFDPVFDPNPFDSVEEARAHFAVEPGIDTASQEPEDILATELMDGVSDQRWIDGLEVLGASEHHV